MPTKDIIVVGASAGGVEALQRLCATLPAGLPASLFIAQHLWPGGPSHLPDLLARAGPLPARLALDGEAIERGRIYLAGPDHHLLLREGRVLVRRGPRENRMRPAINALFRSAALHYGGRVTGVVLTGMLDDGADGLVAIKAAGGGSVVQDPADAAWPAMPRHAVERDHVDHLVPLAAIGELLARLAGEEAGPSLPLPRAYAAEDRIAAAEPPTIDPALATPGTGSRLACPDCGGVLNQIDDAGATRFRCQIGHAFTPLGLADAQHGEVERALGVAVRTHRDRIRLYAQLADNARGRGLARSAARWDEGRQDAEQLLGVLEQALDALGRPRPDDGA